MGRLENRTALITGACGGAGREISQMFAKEGAQVFMVDIDVDRGRKYEELIRQAGGEATFLKCDFTDEEQVVAAVEKAVETYGKLDTLVNIATVMTFDGGLFCDITKETFEKEINYNLRGHFFFCKYVIPYMLKNGKGTIVNFSSVAGYKGDLGSSIYGAAKAGVESITRSIATQYGRNGIRANCIRPGLLMKQEHIELIGKKESLTKNTDTFVSRNLVKRYGTGMDAAYLATFLASDESGYITGETINLDGGMHARAVTWSAHQHEIEELLNETYQK